LDKYLDLRSHGGPLDGRRRGVYISFAPFCASGDFCFLLFVRFVISDFYIRLGISVACPITVAANYSTATNGDTDAGRLVAATNNKSTPLLVDASLYPRDSAQRRSARRCERAHGKPLANDEKKKKKIAKVTESSNAHYRAASG
jgi:hypothetical protein